MAPTAEARSPSRQPRLAHYLISALLARMADEGARVAIVLLTIDRTGSFALGGLFVASLLIPHVVAAPILGSLVDRARRPGVVLALGIAVFAVGLAAVVPIMGHGPWWLSALVLVLAGCGGPAITGGLTSRLAGLVEPGSRARAFGWDSLFYNVASMTGPAVSAVAAATLGTGPATLILAVVAGSGAIGVLTLRLPRADRASTANRADLLGGVRAIVREPGLRTLTVTTSIGQIGLGALPVVATVVAAAAHQPTAGGLLLTAAAGGAFLGSLAWTIRPASPSSAVPITAWTMIGTGAFLALASLTVSSLPLTAILFALAGVFVGPFAAALFLARNQLSTEPVRAQVFTIGAGLKIAAAALGAGLIGFGSHLPAGSQLLIIAASPVLAGVMALLLRRHQLNPTR